MEDINVRDLVEKLKRGDMDASALYYELQDLIETLGKEGSGKNLETLTQIASGLRNDARKTGNIRFFYFGMFQAWVDMLKKSIEAKMANEKKKAQAKMSRFDDIMEYLIKNGKVKRMQMASDLGIDPSHLSRKLNSLTDNGFISQMKIGQVIYYSMTPAGFRFMSERKKQTDKPVIHCSECQWFSKRGYEEDNEGVESDLQSGFARRTGMKLKLVGIVVVR